MIYCYCWCRQTDKQTVGQADSETGRQTDSEKDRIDKQKDIKQVDTQTVRQTVNK